MNYEEKWQAERERAAFLALADGTVFHGVAFGARVDRLGEAVFNTGMSGYQEIVSDPSYAGQIVALTTAEVGNYGTNPDDAESRGFFLSGLIVNDLAEPSNYRSTLPLDKLLAAADIPGIRGLDVRALTLHLRDHGSQKAYLHVSDEPLDPAVAVERARSWEGLDGQDYAAKVSCEVAYDFPHAESTKFLSHAESAENAEFETHAESAENAEPSSFAPEAHPSFAAKRYPSFVPQAHPSFAAKRHPSFSGAADAAAPLVAVYDFGVKTNILRSLASWARVRVFSAKTPAEAILAARPDGVFLSNGPADPAALPYAIENIRKILGLASLDQALVTRHSSLVTPMTGGQRLPVMGICLGHQLLALACGARTMRLKFGHHGCNHPVKDLATGKVEITSQNHNFAVDPATLPDCLEITHTNLNDGTVEGLRHRTLPAFSVQYHPESCPGPHDSTHLFDGFRQAMGAAVRSRI